MYYSFIDASGKHLRKDPENFVLNSITVHESKLEQLDRKINEIKKDYFKNIDPNMIEFHVTSMLHRDGCFKGMKPKRLYKILDEIFSLISSSQDNYFITTSLIKKDRLYQKTDPEKWAYTFLLEKINEEITTKNRQDDISEKCKLIVDTEKDRDYNIRVMIEHVLKHQTKYSDYEWIKKEVEFIDSKDSNLMQIVDCSAYVIRKHWRDGSNKNEYEQKWHDYYSQIKPKFRDNNGKIIDVGLKIFPNPSLFTIPFCEKNKIDKFLVLNEPRYTMTEYGLKYQCYIGCRDDKYSIKAWNISNYAKQQIHKIIGENLLAEKTVKIKTDHSKKFGRKVITIIYIVYKTNLMHVDWFNYMESQ